MIQRLLAGLVLVTALGAADVPPPAYLGERAAITERELEELPHATTFDELRRRLGGYEIKDLERPAVTFRLATNDDDEFIIFWSADTGRLQFIAKYPVGRPRGAAATFVWPADLRGQPMTATLNSGS